MTLFARQYPSEAEAERAYRRRWILIPGVVVLLCVVVGLVYALGPSRTHEELVSQTYPTGITKVEVSGPGDVTLTGAPVNALQATWETHWNYRKPAVRGTRDGDTLKLRLDCSRTVGVECWADLRLAVPKGVGLDVSTADGDVRAVGLDGPVTVHGTDGDVQLADVTGDVDVRGTGGDVRLAGVTGNVTVETTSGDIKAEGLTGKTARLSSNSGDVHTEFGAVPQRVTATSTSGDVQVGVPRPGPYQVRTNARSGDVRTDVNTSPWATPVIQATTTSGDIRVFYADDGDDDHHRNGEPRAPRAPRAPAVPRVPDSPS